MDALALYRAERERRRGMPVDRTPHHFRREEVSKRHQEWRRLYEQECWPVMRIGREHGVSHQTVAVALKKLGVQMRKRGGGARSYVDRIAALEARIAILEGKLRRTA